MSRAVAGKAARGKAAPTPPVGPALGARGVKSMDFCKEFNARTAHISPGVPISYSDHHSTRSILHLCHQNPECIVLPEKSSQHREGNRPTWPRHSRDGQLKHVYEIAKIKATDEHLKHLRLEAIASTIVGSARTLGVQVVP
ncbi:ribosomal protein L11, N-terminal domain-containing protein [Lactarius indigo]|nr:ribosomal protein L11, N-terminal domain-containing protein [Lactarius indigo]